MLFIRWLKNGKDVYRRSLKWNGIIKNENERNRG